MPMLPAPEPEINQGLASQGLSAYPATTADVMAATAADAWARNPTPSLLRWLGRQWDSQTAEIDSTLGLDTPPSSTILTPKDANERFGIEGKLKFEEDTPASVAQDLYDLKRKELYRQEIFARAQGGFGEGIAKFATGLAVSAFDPLNIASAFVPVVGQARYALWLKRATESAEAAGRSAAIARAGVRAGVGAIEGAAGAALVEPIVYGVARSEQADYDATDSLLNIAFGGIIGGGLHAGLGRLGDVIRDRGLAEPTLRDAVSSVIEDRPVSVDAPLKASLLRSADRDISDVVDSLVPREMRTEPFAPPVEVGVRAAEPSPTAELSVSNIAGRITEAESRLADRMAAERSAADLVTEMDAARQALDRSVAELPRETLAKAGIPPEQVQAAVERAIATQGRAEGARLTRMQQKTFREAIDRAQQQAIEAAREASQMRIRTQAELGRLHADLAAANQRIEAGLPVARAGAETETRQRIAAITGREAIHPADRPAVDRIEAIAKRAPEATPEAERTAIEVDMAEIDAMMRQEGPEAPEVAAARKEGAQIVSIAEARAKAAEAAANCQLLRSAAE